MLGSKGIIACPILFPCSEAEDSFRIGFLYRCFFWIQVNYWCHPLQGVGCHLHLLNSMEGMGSLAGEAVLQMLKIVRKILFIQSYNVYAAYRGGGEASDLVSASI